MDRPLPYLIGSQAFMDQEDVGLGDLSSDGDPLHFSLFLFIRFWIYFLYRFPVFNSCLLYLYLEMSIGSDRDSVIESEDEDAEEVRDDDGVYYLHIYVHFFLCTIKK